MNHYTTPKASIWKGRSSEKQEYLHEKIHCCPLSELPEDNTNTIAILGYNCDEGVKRNQGRIGAVAGADAIRAMLGKMPNHTSPATLISDIGNVSCANGDMEQSQETLSKIIDLLLKKNTFPIVLGGGHDIAYGHYKGLRRFLPKSKSIGIINFDAHFDLRLPNETANSGTPFYQIATDCKTDKTPFSYCCLGIRKDANAISLFQTAAELGVTVIANEVFQFENLATIINTLNIFLSTVDYVYVTIDLDGFSSAYAPGVSAPSPMGFAPNVVIACLEHIKKSNKIITMDIAEMNPVYDRDHQTAKLAAALVHAML